MNANPMNANIDYRSLPQGSFPTKNIDRNATQQSPQRHQKREFDYRLIQPKIQNLNTSVQSLSRLRSDTPITIRGQNYRYVGQMNGNQKEGVGSFFTNELEYEGEWQNNVYHGFGKYYQDGKLSYNYFINIILSQDNQEFNFIQKQIIIITTKFNSKLYILFMKSFFLYQGQFKNGLKNGAGIEYYEEDSYFVGNFDKNQKNGIGTLYKRNDKVSGIWQNDKLMEKY